MSVERARVLLESGAYRVVEVVPADGPQMWRDYERTPFVVEVGDAEEYAADTQFGPESLSFVPIGGGPGLPEAAFRTLKGALGYLGELEHLERSAPGDEDAFWRLTERMTEAGP